MFLVAGRHLDNLVTIKTKIIKKLSGAVRSRDTVSLHIRGQKGPSLVRPFFVFPSEASFSNTDSLPLARKKHT